MAAHEIMSKIKIWNRKAFPVAALYDRRSRDYGLDLRLTPGAVW
jgi:hypothetical protein